MHESGAEERNNGIVLHLCEWLIDWVINRPINRSIIWLIPERKQESIARALKCMLSGRKKMSSSSTTSDFDGNSVFCL